MISITIIKKQEQIVGFKSEGHAGYDDIGKDIVCSAVSALIINTVNSIDQFTDDDYIVNQDEDNASIDFCLDTDKPSNESLVLLKSLELGLTSIMKGSPEYVSILFEEV